MKTAFITGYTGQDGTFLTDKLLKKGYHVVGLVRRVSSEPPLRVRGRFDFSEALKNKSLELEMGDLLSLDSLINIIKKHQPDEVYNLAAQSDVHVSFIQPEFTIESTFMGVVNLITALEAVNKADWRMYQASTSEIFGDVKPSPDGGLYSMLDEDTRINPNSPYAISKAAAHYYCAYKRAAGRFISCGILFNHESEIRGGNFVTQKIARYVASYPDSGSFPDQLELGNMDSMRDWGYAGDYVDAMWRMLQHNKPDDFVVATGVSHTVKDFVTAAVNARNWEIHWLGQGKNTLGYVNGNLFVSVSDKYWRPVDVHFLQGDSFKARDELEWVPTVEFEDLVKLMVKNQMEILR